MGRSRSTFEKVRWGARTVGLRATTRGAVRFAWLKVRRPAEVRVKLAGGGVLEFDNPSQLVPALVVFGDVIDPELLLLRRRLRPGAVAVDAGAAIGQFPVVVGQTPGTRLHVFEPSGVNA